MFICVCLSTCLWLWDHVVDSYSPGLYYVNVSLNYYVHRQKLGRLPSCAMSKKKNKKTKDLTHSFQMLSMQMFGREENTPNVKRQKNRQCPVSVGVSRQQNLCIGSRKISCAMGLLRVRCSLLSEVWWSFRSWSLTGALLLSWVRKLIKTKSCAPVLHYEFAVVLVVASSVFTQKLWQN